METLPVGVVVTVAHVADGVGDTKATFTLFIASLTQEEPAGAPVLTVFVGAPGQEPSA